MSAGGIQIVMHARPACQPLRGRILQLQKRVRDAAAAAKRWLRRHAMNRKTVNASLGAQRPAPVVSTLMPGCPRLEIARRGV